MIYGAVTFDEARQEYKMYHADLTKGHEWSVNTTIAVQKEGVLFSIYTQIRITYQQHFNLHRRSTRSIQLHILCLRKYAADATNIHLMM